MHYYQFNIGDYASATAHLEPLEDLAYRRLLDLYYSTEKPIPTDLKQVERLIRMRTHSEFIATVLREFFILEDDGWHCDRVDVEIFKYKEKSYKASKSAKARWKKDKQKQKVKVPCERIANAEETHSERNAKQEPITTNQEPLTKLNTTTDVKPPASKKFNDDDVRFSEWFYQTILTINPNHKKPNFETTGWADAVRLMREQDKRDYQQMSDLFLWVVSDDFWKAQILSPKKFREKWDQLTINMKRPKSASVNPDKVDYVTPLLQKMASGEKRY